jgi:hypothetical protein
LRAACTSALASLAALGPDQVVVIGSSQRTRVRAPMPSGSLAGYGLAQDFVLGSPDGGPVDDLPLSLTIGSLLVAEQFGPGSGAIGVEVGPDFGAQPAARELAELARSGRLGLVVMGDGSARRSTRAPGYLDERAVPFDDAVAEILRAGDGQALADLSEPLGAELLAEGVPAWRATGALVGGQPMSARLLYAEAPYGVSYFVAAWIPR